MREFIDFLSRITVSFTFNFGDVIGLIFVLFGLWTWYLGAKLYAAYTADNAAATFEAWARTQTGKAFLKALIFPFVPLLFVIGIIAFPIIAVWKLIDRWLNRHSD